jgi:hypothetical protein
MAELHVSNILLPFQTIGFSNGGEEKQALEVKKKFKYVSFNLINVKMYESHIFRFVHKS